MSAKLVKISCVTVVLLIVSLVVNWYQYQRPEDVADGADFVSGLDVDKVSKIIMQSNSTEVRLVRDGEKFVIESKQNYPASSVKINELLYKITGLQIEEKVGDSKELHKEFKLEENSSTGRVKLFGASDKAVLDFIIGDNRSGKGTYVRLHDKDIVYLTSGILALNIIEDFYLDREILKLDYLKIKEASISSTEDNYKIVKENTEFKVMGLAKEKVDNQNVQKFVSGFNFVNFSGFHAYNEAELNGLQFKSKIALKMDSGLTYGLEFAKGKDKHYVKASAMAAEMPTQVTISKTDDKDKLLEVDELIKAKNTAASYNLRHGKWIYEISENDYKRFLLPTKEFMRK